MSTSTKPICTHGAECYRKNPQHLAKYSHPHLEQLVQAATANGNSLPAGISDQHLAQVKLLMKADTGKTFKRTQLTPGRAFDPHDKADQWYRVAESFLLRSSTQKITSIDVIYNPTLIKAFEDRKKDFKARGIPHNEVLAFHGTKPANIDNIVNNNLNPQIGVVNGRVHGNGVYLSEHADVSIGYGGKMGLLLFRVLPGHEYTGKDKEYPSGYQCKKVNPDTAGSGWALIMRDASQFVPVAVYNLA